MRKKSGTAGKENWLEGGGLSFISNSAENIIWFWKEVEVKTKEWKVEQMHLHEEYKWKSAN